ncbi:hypothetical protein QUA21_30515 [Microcoleus sp. Pol1B3]
MQQEKYQQQPICLESPGPILFTTRPQQQPSNQKASLVFGGSLLVVGLISGIAIGSFTADRKVVKAQEALKLEQLQRAATLQQVEKMCSEILGR